MAAGHQNQPKRPTSPSSKRAPGTNDGDDEQRNTTPRASAGQPATPMSALDRVRQRRLEAQRARTGRNTPSVDPFVDRLPKSARNCRFSSPYGKVRDMGMGGLDMGGASMGSSRYENFQSILFGQLASSNVPF